ncbi:G5 domain-containing protein [Mangrovibacillus cuniculi]|uniref:G5 domain-containing protein n=1 Tax=Mangrovibacillus cuniculi TaxID=2593652 RepID=A0A7S8HFZ6_9BACI|nr:G5 domain-containing protein [Mangrovibacillus cuniculi]QPC47061.1 hypothetical protein G8O30_08825 [Mangrovibacillus cuniculi]
MNSQRFAMYFIMLVLCTSFMLTVSQLGPIFFSSIVPSSSTYEEGTKLGGLDISGMTREEAATQLTNKVNEWREAAIIEFRIQGEAYFFPKDEIRFTVDETYNPTSGINNPVPVGLEVSNVDKWIKENIPTEIASVLDIELLTVKIKEVASFLVAEPTLIRAEEVLVASALTESYLVEKVRLLTSSNENWTDISTLSITIDPKSTISFLQKMEEDGVTDLSEIQQEMLASLTYELVLETPFEVRERNYGRTEPTLQPLGLEVDLSEALNKDFVFYNPTETSYELTFSTLPGGIAAQLSGMPFLFSYEMEIRQIQEFPPRIIKQFNPLLTIGTKNILEEGSPGKLISVYQIIQDESGAIVEEKLVSEDFYPPVHRIEVHSILNDLVSSAPSSSETVTPPVDEQNNEDTGRNPPSNEEKDRNNSAENESSRKEVEVIWEEPAGEEK